MDKRSVYQSRQSLRGVTIACFAFILAIITHSAVSLASESASIDAYNTANTSNTTVSPRQNITRSHAISLYGDPKYPKGFSHFDWVNPEAPKGGRIRLMGFGSFDSGNPYTLKGTSPFNTPGMFMYGFTELNETLMIGTGSYSPSADEGQTAYGLIAESLSYPDDYSWVEYTLRPNAKFHDGHPITAEDVVFSFNTLINYGHPRFQQSLLDIDSVSAVSTLKVRFTMKPETNKQAIFRAGELPILPKHFWKDKDFATASEEQPLLSGPYKIKSINNGASFTLERVEDFWAKDLNVYRGRYNFDEVHIDFYRDQSVAFEAFKSGEFDLFYDYTAKNWAQAYDFPSINQGLVSREEIPHSIPAGTQGFFFNTRRELFKDIRVRRALTELFDFEWINSSLFHNAYARNHSYFPNSQFAHQGPPSDEERQLLKPFEASLPSALFEHAFRYVPSNGSGQIRDKMRKALKLLKEAGWEMKNNQLWHAQSNRTFEFEFIYRQAGLERVIMPFVKNLGRIGIHAKPRLIESAQYKARLDQFDFDMMTFVLSQGTAPSYEQRDYYHSELVDVTGSQNYAGINNDAVDHLIDKLINAKDEQELTTIMRALDRVLMFNYYIVPNWHIGIHRLAYWNKFERPQSALKFKLGTENWWIKQAVTP